MNSALPKMGEHVRFRGGTGRNDEDRIFEGIVNGEPIEYPRERLTYVRVYLRESDQCVLVNAANLVGDDA